MNPFTPGITPGEAINTGFTWGITRGMSISATFVVSPGVLLGVTLRNVQEMENHALPPVIPGVKVVLRRCQK